MAGKHTADAALEAARLARAAGKPVKVVWTREEEFTWAYFRPAGVIEIKSGVAGDGTLTAWEFHNYNSGASGIETPYTVANQHVQFHPCHSPLRQGSYRGLAATANVFARESHMDDLARAAQMDPLDFRLKNIADSRLREALQAAAKSFGWPAKKSQPGQRIRHGRRSGKGRLRSDLRGGGSGWRARRRARGAGGDCVRLRRGSESRWSAQSNYRREHHGTGRRAFRSD